MNGFLTIGEHKSPGFSRSRNSRRSLGSIRGKAAHSARLSCIRGRQCGNAAAVQRQLGHSNVAYSLQYARITDEELQDLLDKR